MIPEQKNLLPDYRLILLSLGFFLLAYLLLPILSPFLMAGILAYICNPLVDRLSAIQLGKFSLGRALGTVIVMLMLIGIVIVFLLIVVPLFQKELWLIIQRLPTYATTLHDKLEPILLKHFGISLSIDASQIQEILTKNWKTASNFAGQFLLQLSSHGIALIAWLVSFLLVPVVLFYTLRDWHQIIARIAQLIPRKWLAKTTSIATEIDTVLAEFLRGQLAVMMMMSAFYATSLWFTGLELALPIGLISGLLGFVPYLGISTGISLAVLASALQFTSLGQMVPVLAVFGVGQVLESFLLTPLLVGDRIGLHPVVVIFALLAGGQLFGFAGILLALPVSAAIAVGLRHAKRGYLQSSIYLGPDNQA